VNAVRAQRGEAPQSLEALTRAGVIEYIPFPPALVGKYQSFTQADMSRLRGAGLPGDFMSVEQGVAAYVAQLIKQ